MHYIDSNPFHLLPAANPPGYDYGYFCREKLVELLHAAGLDAVYERASGNTLWQRRGDGLHEVLDMVGGYGANLFGHNNPELVEALKKLLDEQTPAMAQASVRKGAAQLAKALCDRLGDFVVILTNSGTETIEAALKHAYLERQRPLFWAAQHGFHGKTSGAIQLTWSYREKFAHWGPKVTAIDVFDPASWEAHLKQINEVCAVVLEPILGEGGIRPLPALFVKWITRICKEENIPIIADEIQTGMGRTGSFIASTEQGLDPDYICLSKSLGGGLSKIGALLIRRTRFVDDFAIEHTSTFAEDDLSCGVSLKALELLDRDALPARCQAMGAYLLQKLAILNTQYPDVIEMVRGRGLMVGVELVDQTGSVSHVLDVIASQGYLGFVAAGYLLNIHNIRVMPTLSQPLTLRIEPSAYITSAEIDRFVDALGAFCAAIRRLDLLHLTGHLVDCSFTAEIDYTDVPRVVKRTPAHDVDKDIDKVAFITHLIDPGHLGLWDPSFGELPADKVSTFMRRAMRPFVPAIGDQQYVTSATGERVHLSSVSLYLTSEAIMYEWSKGNVRWLRNQLELAVSTARDHGCALVGLGGYTSIVTGNGRHIETTGIGVTTGNALTVGMGVQACLQAALKEGVDFKNTALGVVGAAGNIARMYTLMMAAEVDRLVLVVSNPEASSVTTLLAELTARYPTLDVFVCNQMAALKDCRMILAASNSPHSLIYPEHLSEAPVVICDLALPADVDEQVREMRPDVTVISGGVVKLPPGNESFQLAGLALPPGYAYACIAETLLLGLEASTTGTTGSVTLEGVMHMMHLANKHGFTLGKLKEEQLPVGF